MTEHRARQLARAAWLALIAWQFTWLMLLPPPLGKQSVWLTAAVVAPMLLPLWGILGLRARSLIWGGYIALLAGMFGMMEWWAAPQERPAASLQLLLCVAYLVALAFGTRKRRD